MPRAGTLQWSVAAVAPASDWCTLGGRWSMIGKRWALAAMLLLPAGAARAQETAVTTAETAARGFVALLASGDYATAETRLDTTMRRLLPASRLAETWASVQAQAGAGEHLDRHGANSIDHGAIVSDGLVRVRERNGVRDQIGKRAAVIESVEHEFSLFVFDHQAAAAQFVQMT